VTLWVDVVNSPTLSPEQNELIMRRLSTHTGKDRVLRVVSQQTCSQAENCELAMEHFVELLRDAAKQIPIKKKSRLPKGRNSAAWRKKTSAAS
jgi:hypothetical protein